MINGLVDIEVQWAAEKARKVRPIILGGVFNLAALDPMITSMTMEVSVWVEGKASDLRDKLVIGANLSIEELGRGANATLQGLSVGVGTLEPQVRQMFEGLRITSQQAGGLVREGLTGLRGAAGSGPVLIAVGTLYLLSDVMKRNFEAVSEVIGDKSPEARMAFYGSAMGVTGGAVELVGLVMEKGAQKIIDANRLAARGMGNARDITRVGNVLVRTGATMVAAAGMYDAAQAGMAAARTWQNGDSEALRAYSVSTVGFAIGSALGMSAGATGALTLMGPLGWALIFGMLSYGIFKWAEDLESTPLEIWARRSFFGHHNETPPIHWYQPEDADRAIAALNAVTLGIYVDLSFQLQLRGIDSHSASGVLGVPGSPRQELYLEYSLRLPYFNQDRSAYRWTLTIHRKGSSHLDNAEADVLTRSNFGTPRLRQNAPFGHRAANPPSASQASSDELKSKVAKGQLLRENLDNNRILQTKCYKGSIDLMNYDQNKNIERADLVLSYWPDCDIADGYTEVNIATINPYKLSR